MMSAKTFRIAGWTILLAGAGLFLFAWSGVYDVAASKGHFPWTRWFLDFGMRNSVALRARFVAEPPSFDAALVERGAGHYHGGCAFCHGAPGVPASPLTSQMLPPPPDLAGRVAEWSDAELFRVVKHGIKYTGMPAWPALARDDEVWAVVAFVRRLPRLDPAEYRKLTGTPGLDAQSPATLAAGSPEQLGPIGCARCHGLNGEGGDAGAVPRLAGQKSEYLLMALEAYASGARPSGVMAPVVAHLSREEMAGLANHFGALEGPKGGRGDDASPADKASVALGATIAADGIPGQKMPACAACHGDQGDGKNSGPRFPVLSGQGFDYLRQQLELFRSGARGGPLADVMTKAIKGITDEQIRAVALYYEGLPE